MSDHTVSLTHHTEQLFSQLEAGGKTVVAVTVGGKAAGLMAIADELKESSKDAVNELKKLGCDVAILTGDNEMTARTVADLLGVDRVFANVLPGDKAAKVKSLQGEGEVVAMVGDGINDAPALAQADVGIAIGAGADVAKETGGIVLMRSNPMDVAAAIDLSRSTVRKMKQNLFWAFIYNTALIPVAAGLFYPLLGILLNPVFAAIAMATSSVTVVGNSLLLTRYKKPVGLLLTALPEPAQ